MRRALIVGWVLASLGLVACGGASAVESPCELADAAMVQAVFGGTVSPGVEGGARDCEFSIVGGVVESLSVFEFGDSSTWDGVRSGYDDNRGGTSDVAGVGDEAFFPNDVGPLTLIVKAGPQNFAVDAADAFKELPPQTSDLVEELAKDIAARIEQG